MCYMVYLVKSSKMSAEFLEKFSFSLTKMFLLISRHCLRHRAYWPIAGCSRVHRCKLSRCRGTNRFLDKNGKGSPYSIPKRRVPKPIPVLGSQPAGDVSYKPGGRLPLLFARPAVTPATLKRAATNFAAWWTEAQWVWTVCIRLLPDSVSTAIWTQVLLRLSPAR